MFPVVVVAVWWKSSSLASGCYMETLIGPKITRQMRKRGWNASAIRDTVALPEQTVAWRDRRHLPDGTQMDESATAFIRLDGSYVVRNDRTGEVVQISDRTDPNWIAPWD